MHKLAGFILVSFFFYTPTFATISDAELPGIMNDLKLSRSPVELTLLSEKVTGTGQEIHRDIELAHPDFDPIFISIKHPAVIKRPLPVILILSGFGTGRRSLDLIQGFGDNIIVSYEYPSPIDPQRIFFDLNRLRKAPGQVLGVLNWLHKQTYVDPTRISFMTVSFGTLFLPIIQRIALEQGFQPKTTILAYGGVDIPVILEPQFRQYLGELETRFVLNRLAEQIYTLEPKHHLAALKGVFLVVHAQEEQVFPPLARQKQIELTPEPKTVVILPGQHLNPDNGDGIKAFAELSRKWLIEKGAINP